MVSLPLQRTARSKLLTSLFHGLKEEASLLAWHLITIAKDSVGLAVAPILRQFREHAAQLFRGAEKRCLRRFHGLDWTSSPRGSIVALSSAPAAHLHLRCAAAMKKLGFSSAILLGCFAVLWFSPPCSTVRSFDNLERNAERVTTAAELQAWALKVVAQYPSPTNGYEYLRRSDLKTDIPRPLLGLYHNPPAIFVYETTADLPGHVRLIWGGGMIGHCGFEIGPTNFVSRGHLWQDGVYFWSDNDH